MLLKERIAALFEPKEVKKTEEITARQAALTEEGKATVAYLKWEISMNEYKQIHDRLSPLINLTKLDLQKLDQHLKT